MLSSKLSVILPFSQDYYSATTPVNVTLGGTPGSTGHLKPWKYVGLNEDVWLYKYDNNNNAKTWYLNLLNGTIENTPIEGVTKTLKYLNKSNETYNFLSFYVETIKVSLHHELNTYYSLENLYITTELDGTPFVKRFFCHEIVGNSYFFHVNSNLSIPTADAIDNAFTFTLKYRENLDKNIFQTSIRHDPRHTEIFKLELSGYSLDYDELKLSNNSIDLRLYSKRIYIRDAVDHGYLRYDKIKERFGFLTPTGSTAYTMFEFNIVDSSLYNILIHGAELGNKVLVPELKIKGGKFVASIKNSELISNNESVVIEYCELYLYDSELEKVPFRSNILRISKTNAYS